jgi:serine/threonine protein kinase
MTLAVGNAGALIGHRMGKYELLALLALGGTSEIYLARIGGVAGFEKYVVVKCLHDHLADDSEFVRMFLDEARLTAQLDHSNIVQTIELGEEGGRYYIVMEYLAGMSLALVARRAIERVPGGRMPVDLTLCLAAQACSGLHYAHQRTDMAGNPLNIVHRDVSPQNLVVSFEGIVKLVDFGIAKAEMRDTSTRSGTIKGKFAYMSPEQCKAGQVDHRTDVFAMGVVVHELLTGKRLFKRAATYDTYKAIVDSRIPAPSEVNHELDPALDEVVMKALTRDREDRYASAEAFGEALARALHRRGQAVSAGMVATFFEQYLGKEMGEHAERMRALIAGRQTPIDEQWDDPDAVSDIGHPDRPFDSVGHTLDRPGPGRDLGLMATILAPGDLDGEATRIELNPMLEDEQLTVSREPEPHRRSGILPLPADPDPEPQSETMVGGDLAPSGGARKPGSASGLRKLTPTPTRPGPNPAAQDTVAMSSFEDSGSGRTPLPTPAPPRLPDSGAAARGRGHSSGEFGSEKTAPAGPQGLRGRTSTSDGMGDEEQTPTDDIPAGVHPGARSGAHAVFQPAESVPLHVEYPVSGTMDRLGSGPMDRPVSGPMDRPVSGPMDRPVSGPMDRPVSGPMDRPVSGPMRQPGSGPQRRPGPGTGPMPRLPPMWGGDSGRLALNRRTVPVWFLGVLFVISIGVGLGATLLINLLFF